MLSMVAGCSVAVGNFGNGSKRKRSSDESDSNSDADISVRHKLLILESEESCPTFEDSESCSSFQEMETDVPRDHPNSDSSVEFTLASNSETEKGSSSGCSEINTKKIDTIIIIEDIGLLGGSSDSYSDRDSEMPKADFWSCKCGAKKNNPRFGTCQKCFKARTSFLPSRPKRKMRRRRMEKKQSSQVPGPSSGPTTSSLASLSSAELPTTSEGYVSQCSSQESLSVFMSQANLSQGSLLDASTSSLSELSQPSDNKCSVCLDQPVDGIFVHGNSGHDYACYRCSVRIYKDKKRCPICNRAVNNVIRLFKSRQ